MRYEDQGENVRNVISESNTHPDRGRLPCMAVAPLSCSATIKGGAHWGMGTNVSTVPPQTLATKTDQESAEARGLVHLATNRRPSPTPCRPPRRFKVYPCNP
jgi:hypothetical protein